MTKSQRIAELEAKVDSLQRSVANLEHMMTSFVMTPLYMDPSYPSTPYDPNFWQPKVTC